MSQCKRHLEILDLNFPRKTMNETCWNSMTTELHFSSPGHQIRILYPNLQGIHNPVAAALYPWKLTWPISVPWKLDCLTRGDEIHCMQAEGEEDCKLVRRFQVVTSKQHPDFILQRMHESPWFIIKPGFRRNTPACSLLQQLQKDCKRLTRCKFHG